MEYRLPKFPNPDAKGFGYWKSLLPFPPIRSFFLDSKAADAFRDTKHGPAARAADSSNIVFLKMYSAPQEWLFCQKYSHRGRSILG